MSPASSCDRWLWTLMWIVTSGLCLVPAERLVAQDDAGIVDAAELSELAQPAEPAATEAEAPRRGISVLMLISEGGPLIIPIGLMSVLVVTLGAERLIGLRRGVVLPSGLVKELETMSRRAESFDPQMALAHCRRYPSAASRVVQAMLMRCGRPPADIEQAGAEAAQRETDRLGAPVRWLHLASGVTPLMGLFGTVWGMIVAFHDLTQMAPGQNKAEALAHGIYTALVTTVAGLAVAIPATICAHYFEGRLLKLMRGVEELAFRVAPGLDRFANRVRMDAEGQLIPLGGAAAATVTKAPPPPVVPPPVHAVVASK